MSRGVSTEAIIRVGPIVAGAVVLLAATGLLVPVADDAAARTSLADEAPIPVVIRLDAVDADVRPVATIRYREDASVDTGDATPAPVGVISGFVADAGGEVVCGMVAVLTVDPRADPAAALIAAARTLRSPDATPLSEGRFSLPVFDQRCFLALEVGDDQFVIEGVRAGTTDLQVRLPVATEAAVSFHRTTNNGVGNPGTPSNSPFDDFGVPVPELPVPAINCARRVKRVRQGQVAKVNDHFVRANQAFLASDLEKARRELAQAVLIIEFDPHGTDFGDLEQNVPHMRRIVDDRLEEARRLENGLDIAEAASPAGPLVPICLDRKAWDGASDATFYIWGLRDP